MSKSNIQWTDETLNLATGCTRVSPGCDNCYMFALYPRLHGMGVKGYEATPDVVTLQSERLDQIHSWTKPRRVFVNSMSDTFHPHIPFSEIDEWYYHMKSANKHTFQLLTKRPGRAVAWWERYQEEEYLMRQRNWPEVPEDVDKWASNIWLGTSVENQKYAPRLDVLARVDAPVRFVSAEPLLGPLDLSKWLKDGSLNWCIVGGESGPHARPMDMDWVRSLRDQCQRYGVPFFLKQLGGRQGHRGGDEAVVDGKTWTEFPDIDRVAQLIL